MPSSRSLFGPPLPRGFQYRDDFISEQDEAALLAGIGTITFSTFEMRGVVARRRVAFFGNGYGGAPASQMPGFLSALRMSLSRWAGVDADAFAVALINEYPAGAPIGWHRDAPQYDSVAGLSLLSDCRMRFRPYDPRSTPETRPKRTATHEIVLAPRSAYLLTGDARSRFEHQIPPVAAKRYSITFRTLR